MTLGGHFDFESLEEKIASNEFEMSKSDFWGDYDKAQQLINQNNDSKNKYDNFKKLQSKEEDLEVSLELLLEEFDEDLKLELENNLIKVKKLLVEYQMNILLNGKYDNNNAILEIHPGAGGTESQDWGMMLVRMYTRWSEQHGFKVIIEDYQPGEVAGISSVTLRILGDKVYGYLRSEKGVHRLVRISPFDSAGRRHTSFASVNVMPELDDSVEVEINSDDLRIDVYRASGAGGQHVNKTSSAVRITHLPTNVVVASQSERSQIQNRATAMKMLKSKLFELEEEKKVQEKLAIEGQQLEIGWGSQIRSYVFHPYSMVKDHRTKEETANVDKVMDGDLDVFINAYLKWDLNKNL